MIPGASITYRIPSAETRLSESRFLGSISFEIFRRLINGYLTADAG